MSSEGMHDFLPKISIIFPSYNGEKFLRRNLDSIKQLSNINEIELIIVDNNSKDSSKEIIKSYSKTLHVKLVELNNNVGFGKACNLGATYAKGEFIFITNQDMLFLKNFFQELLTIYKNYKKNQEIIISPAIIFEGNGIHYFGAKIHILGFSYSPNLGQKLPRKKIIMTTQRFSGGSLFIKKELFVKLGGFDDVFFMYYEDTDLSLRVMRQGLKIYTTNIPYLIHQKHKWDFNDFRYYLLERNRFILIFKNISNYRKLIPLFIIIELILIFQSILIRKFKFRIRIYYELLSKLKFIKYLRNKSKEKMILIPYQKLDRYLDPILLGEMKDRIFFNQMLSFINFFLKLF